MWYFIADPDTKTGNKKSTSPLKRTTPVTFCKVGGEDTFHKTFMEPELYVQLHRSYHNNKHNLLAFETELNLLLQKDLKSIERKRKKLEVKLYVYKLYNIL